MFNETNDIEIKPYEAKPYEVEYYEVRSNEIDYIDTKSYEPISNNIESNETEFNEDYCIENIKNEFNKLSNNLVETDTKDIRYIVDNINNGENLKETLQQIYNKLQIN